MSILDWVVVVWITVATLFMFGYCIREWSKEKPPAREGEADDSDVVDKDYLIFKTLQGGTTVQYAKEKPPVTKSEAAERCIHHRDCCDRTICPLCTTTQESAPASSAQDHPRRPVVQDSEAKGVPLFCPDCYQPLDVCSGPVGRRYRALLAQGWRFVPPIPTTHTQQQPETQSKQTSSRKMAIQRGKPVVMVENQKYRVPPRQTGSDSSQDHEETDTSDIVDQVFQSIVPDNRTTGYPDL